MRHILVEIHCRSCGYHTHIKSHTLVQPQLEPLLRERILQQRMFTYECPCCHTKIGFIHSFLYHDRERQFLIYMNAKQAMPEALREQFPSARFCVVSNPQQLSECILLYEDELEIEAITVIKQKIQAQDKKITAITYHDKDKLNHMLWFTCTYQDHREYKAVAYSAYEQIKQKQKKGVDHE